MLKAGPSLGGRQMPSTEGSAGFQGQRHTQISGKMTRQGEQFPMDLQRVVMPTSESIDKLNDTFHGAVVVEKLHEDEITVQVDDYAAAENLVKAYSTVGHAHHSIMSAMKGNKLGLKFEKKAIPVTSKEEEQKYGTLVTVTSVGLDMTFVRKLTNFIISSL
ncbi:uncharacterized protein LOC142575553 isoform X2 [Dermacentor variabilis]|uniref:uncharacterized protein LOC142575553 isoform X2 n=1 Tax=Dermacentor variabilis TaxID=34621 RepID=UPI003F5B27D5